MVVYSRRGIESVYGDHVVSDVGKAPVFVDRVVTVRPMAREGHRVDIVHRDMGYPEEGPS